MQAKDMLTSGWDGLRNQGFSPFDQSEVDKANYEQQMAQYEAAVQQYEEAELYAATFGTPAGKAVLKHMDDNTIQQPAFTLGAVLIEGHISNLPAEQQGFIREGQNSMVRHIYHMIAIANGPAPDRPIAPNEEAQKDG